MHGDHPDDGYTYEGCLGCHPMTDPTRDALREAIEVRVQRQFDLWRDGRTPNETLRTHVINAIRRAKVATPDPAPAQGGGLDVETLREALEPFMNERGQYTGITPERLAAEYARLRDTPSPEEENQ